MESKQPPLTFNARRALSRARKRLDLTQRAAAMLCEVTPAFLCNLERGEYGATLATLNRIAKRLGLRVELKLIKTRKPKKRG